MLIAKLIGTSPLLIDLFDKLKAHLVTGHQVTNIQRVEKLLGLPAMGQQKPSELLPEMLQICPRVEENSVFFNCLFLQKLLRALRILLLEVDMAYKRLFSKRADQICARNTQLHHYMVAALSLQQPRSSHTAQLWWPGWQSSQGEQERPPRAAGGGQS